MELVDGWPVGSFSTLTHLSSSCCHIEIAMDQWTNGPTQSHYLFIHVYPPILETPKELSCWVSFDIQQVGEEINRPLISPLTFPIFASNHPLQFCLVGWFASFPKKAITISDSILCVTHQGLLVTELSRIVTHVFNGYCPTFSYIIYIYMYLLIDIYI